MKILISVLLLSYVGFPANAISQANSCLHMAEFGHTAAQLRVIATALGLYAEDHSGSFPRPEGSVHYIAFPGQRAKGPNPLRWPVTEDFRAQKLRPYLQRYIPKDRYYNDGWGGPINYAVSKDGKHFVLYSYGKDKKRNPVFHYTWPIQEECDPNEDMIRDELVFVSFPDGITR